MQLGAVPAALLSLARFAVIGAVLALIASRGALPLLVAALGILAARPLFTRLLTVAP
jgi:hypothetical protein